MLGWLLRLLLLFLLVRALMLIVGGLLRGIMGVPQATGGGDDAAPRAGGRAPQSSGTLVRDPVCGTYVPQARALTARTASGDTAFFCSEACRSAYDAQAAGAR